MIKAGQSSLFHFVKISLLTGDASHWRRTPEGGHFVGGGLWFLEAGTEH